MLALILAGGRGRRLGGGEKPLALCNGRPMIEWVVDAVVDTGAEAVVVASPWTPFTQNWCRAHDLLCVCTEGAGYIEDLAEAVGMLGLDEPFLSLSADLPCLTSAIVDEVVAAYERQSCPALSVWVPVGDENACVEVVDGRRAIPAGINVLHAGMMDGEQEECRLLLADPVLCHNVNTRVALAAAEAHLLARQSGPDSGCNHRKKDIGPDEI